MVAREYYSYFQVNEPHFSFDKISGEDTVKSHITNLRKKLKAVGASDKIIETIYGLGYRLGNS